MAIETNELIDVKTLSPFKRFIMTIGNLPTSYLESMTYGEMLMWFCNYLQETVIPTVNNNAEAVEELQNLYEELKQYVDDYFDNLDVQDEINNKLDALVEDGTLEGLMEDAIPKNMIVIGDSWSIFNQYIVDGHPVLDDPSEIWCSIVAKQLHLNIKNFAIAGAGYTRSSQLFTVQYNQILADDTINQYNTDLIVVCGGINDLDHGVPANVTSAATTLFNNLKEHFPNSKIIAFGCNTQYKFRHGIENTTENNMSITKKIQQACYDTGVGFINMMPAMIGISGFYGATLEGQHPTKAGMLAIASYFLSCYNGNGSRKPTEDYAWTTLTPQPTNLVYEATKDDSENPNQFYYKTNIINNELIVEFRFQVRTVPEASTYYEYTIDNLIIPCTWGLKLEHRLYRDTNIKMFTTISGNSTKVRINYERINVTDAFYGTLRIQI